MFRHNVGGVDRILRVTLGGILFLGGILLLTDTIRLGWILVVVGLLALLTGIVGFCALYIPFGISTGRPEGQPLNQACDCGAWMKAMEDNRTGAPAGSAEKKVAGAMTTARGR